MTMKIALRPYQVDMLDKVRARYLSGASSVCLVSPTGSGKTVMFCSIVDGAKRKGSRCLIVAHRAEIVEQTSNALVDLGVPHGVVAPGYPSTPEPVQVASVQSLVRRLDQHNHYDLVVIDETHHAVAGTWRRIIEAVPQAKILGVTATPERLDGRGLGDIFDTMVMGPTTAQLIKDAYLAPYAAFAPTEVPDLSSIGSRAGDFAVDQLSSVMARPVVIGSAVASYERFAIGKRAVAFCSTVRTAWHWRSASPRTVTKPFILIPR
jgi:superfamily II DNA or RNA helicase